MFIRNCIRSNIIKRAFSHHRDLIQTPGSTLPDKVKLESYVQDLTNKINHIQTKIDIINKKISSCKNT
jgi:enamine deaminase RidA (YjgF/YER057c/UK114 family)